MQPCSLASIDLVWCTLEGTLSEQTIEGLWYFSWQCLFIHSWQIELRLQVSDDGMIQVVTAGT